MVDTAIALLESSMIPSVDLLSKNSIDFNRLEQITEGAQQMLRYYPQKVTVCANPDNAGTYCLEFSNNLDRLMRDQNLDINEAVQEVAECNNISVRDCTVVFTNESLDKINIDSVIKSDREFNIARM